MDIRYQSIAIKGVIGAGKTTIAKYLSEQIPAKLILEEFEDNPFLAQFYNTPDKFAFPLELSFLASRYHQLRDYYKPAQLFGEKIVSDFVLYKSLVFASITLHGDELNLYRKLFDIMFTQMPKPDLTIYIYHKTDQLLENIRTRGRVYEHNISSDYLEQLNETYMNYFKQLPEHRIVVVDGRKFDIVRNPASKHSLIELLSTDFPLGINNL